jgi:hypothetical protein
MLMCLHAAEPDTDPAQYFGIEVLDEQTGRGVPMVELQTTYGGRYYTDSAGLVAFHEPGLMGKKVFFTVASHGYEFAKDGFGIQGVALETKAGSSAKLKIKRINIAERLYRITGTGIYRDSVLLGRKTPVAQPLLNAEVTGQDSVLTAVYRDRTFWFYGDTGRLAYALGNFATSGATTDRPDKLEPELGFNLKYFAGKDGFSRPMAPMNGEGVVWLSGLVVVPDNSGRERMLAYFQRRRGLGAVLDEGFVEYDDASETFQKVTSVPANPPIVPTGHAMRTKDNGVEYLVFTAPYPALRVRADRASYFDLSSYEGYTCLKLGGRFENAEKAELDRGGDGKLVWTWKKNTPPVTPKQQSELVAAGKMERVESPFRLQDAAGGKPVTMHNGSCAWNAYRKKYILIASEVLGATVLGEVWYAEADRPEGPWIHARKIITHANKPGDAHDFYNPTQHAFLDREGGRYIYLEGTYVNTFSGNPHPTPYYEYNQIMYRLDLVDPRLKLPEGDRASDAK